MPRGDQGVVEFRQLLIQTELTLREILPHAHQLALKRPKQTFIHIRTLVHASTQQVKNMRIRFCDGLLIN